MNYELAEYLLITKECYSDGVSGIYEQLLQAVDLNEAKNKAIDIVNERNSEMSKYGKCFIVDVRKYIPTT